MHKLLARLFKERPRRMVWIRPAGDASSIKGKLIAVDTFEHTVVIEYVQQHHGDAIGYNAYDTDKITGVCYFPTE